MWSTREVGSLAVIENTPDRKRIEAELQKFDQNLFLDAEVDVHRRFVWSVKEHIGSEHPPHLLFEWRDERGEPLPLSWGLIEEVRKMAWRKDHGISVFDVVSQANEARRAELMRRSASEYEAIAEDIARMMNPLRSGVLPRSQALRMSRDKQRARGWKV